MRKVGLTALATLLLFLCLVPSVSAALTPLEREAAQQAVQACVQSLGSTDIEGMNRIAVLKLDNDDGEITDLLTIALTKTPYSVVLREELEKVLTEHEFNIRHADMIDASTMKKLGGFLGVDGLIIGSVQEQSGDQHQAHLRLNLKLANVETGEAVWGEVALGETGSAPPPPAPPEPLTKKLSQPAVLIVLICIMLFIIWLVMVARKPVSDALENRYVVKQDRLDSDQRLRNNMVRQLGSAIDSLRNARNRAHDAGNDDLRQKLKDCEHSVDLLRMEISNAEYGALPFFEKDKVETRHLDKMVDFDKTFESLMKDIVHECSEVEKASADNPGDAGKSIEKVSRLAKQLKDKFQERKSYLAGVG